MVSHHIIAFLMGFVLDLIIGDPVGFPHPVKLIGALISKLDHHFMGGRMNSRGGMRRDGQQEFKDGAKMCAIVIASTAVATLVLLFISYKLHAVLGIFVEAVLTAYALAARSLQYESNKVFRKLKNGTPGEARRALSMIVGRDTNTLESEDIARATVETISENTSDGVISPMFYLAIGGPVLGFIYKAINTMDSMVGYHNDRYENFGRAAAKLDDYANYIPARIAAWLMIAASYIAGKEYSGEDALRIYKRDNYKTKSPNAGQTESACAGALGIRLGGDATYGGKLVKKAFLGDELRKVDKEDIRKANKLMYLTECLFVLICFALMMGVNTCINIAG